MSLATLAADLRDTFVFVFVFMLRGVEGRRRGLPQCNLAMEMDQVSMPIRSGSRSLLISGEGQPLGR